MKDLDLTETKGFLSTEECKKLISVFDIGKWKEIKHDWRKVRVKDISQEIASPIMIKMSKIINIPISHAETLKFQKYSQGGLYRPHLDCAKGLPRIHTFMIYLNDNFEGGETNFSSLNQKINPETGKGVHWRCTPESKHEGLEVTKGTKYIITSWWRDKPYKR